MAKHKNWKNVSSSFLLKLDPFYNRKINDSEEFVPSEHVFFRKLYISPSSINGSVAIDNEIKSKIKGRTKNLVVCIKGYAGSGKSVYIQKLMHDFYPRNDNFARNTYNLNFKKQSIHRLEIGAGTSSNDITSRYVDDLSSCIANGIKYDRNVFSLFCTIVANNDDAIRYIDNGLELHDKFIHADSVNDCLDKSCDEIKNVLRLELKQYDLSILFAIDCLWRIAFYAYEQQYSRNTFKDAMFFICFDNLDAIDDVDMCRDFIKCMCEFRTNLDECMYLLNKDHPEYHIKTFTFIITCRNVTWGRLHLSEYAEDDDAGDISAHLCDYDISSFYEYVDIVESRIKYFSTMVGKNHHAIQILSEMDTIRKLNSMLYVRERFKPLFNYNYRKCIDVISTILRTSAPYLEEAIQLADGHDLFSQSDAVYSGSSSIFFRLVFEYFKDRKLFGYDIMGLVDLDTPYNDDCENRILTSQARIILMYLYNESKKYNGGRTRLDQIFEYFEPVYSLTDICDTIYNLFARNTAWRRPINFSKRPLTEHKEKDDLYEQMEEYKANGKQNPSKFTKFEICKAGEEYIEFVIAHFEFFSCRASEPDHYLPPLFCKESCSYDPIEDKYQFEETCAAVIDAVSGCCKKLSVFNQKIMDAKGLDKESYLKEPIIKKTGRNKPQLHEERVIFCHIYHLESYRQYLINCFYQDESDIFRADINKRLVQIIQKYIDLYKEHIISSPRDKVIKTLEHKRTTIELSGYLDFITKIARD